MKENKEDKLSQRIVYIVSKVDKAVAFEWIVEAFLKVGIEVQFVLLNDNHNTALADFLRSQRVSFYQFKLGTKKNFPKLWFKLFRLLRRIKPSIVHTHLFEASLLGLSAAKLAGINKRIYTRHHSTFHHEYFPQAVKYDKWINLMASDIIAISSNVKNVLIRKENVQENKVHLITHGFKLEQFENVTEDRVNALKVKYKIPKDKLIIATVSRYIELKGLRFVTQAFKNIYQESSGTHLLLANAGGGDEAIIKEHLKELPEHAYTEIKFEEDLFALYQLFDIYIHVPVNKQIEAFGQTYVEALAAGIPSVFTLSGIATDFIEHEFNALVVEYKNSRAIELAIKRLIDDEALRSHLVKNGKQTVRRFELEKMISKLQELYEADF